MIFEIVHNIHIYIFQTKYDIWVCLKLVSIWPCYSYITPGKMMMNSQFWGHPIGRCCKSCGWRSQSLTFFGRNFAVPVQSISTSNCNWSAIMHFHHSGSWQMDGNSYFWHKYIEYLPIIVLLCLVVCRCCTGGWCKSLGTRWQNFVIKQANHLSDLMSGFSLDNSDVLVSFLKTSLCWFCNVL